MKKILSILMACLMLISIGALVAACSAGDAEDTILEKSLDLAKTGTDDYVKEVDEATASDVDGLKKEGQDLLDSFDDITDGVEAGDEDLSDEQKNTISQEVDELRQTVTDAMAKLDTIN